jgi:G3E family GTPase
MTNGVCTLEHVEVSLVTGFLGSGKTTLLRHLLRHPAMRETAVVVNELGAVGLDHQLMETTGRGAVLLESGCICCSLDGSLIETIDSLLRQRRKDPRAFFRRILVETTGLADPGPVIHALFDTRAARLGVRLDRVIVLVDAVAGWATLDRHDVAVRQTALADCLLVSKTDLADCTEVRRLLDRLVAINPRATPATVRNGEIDPARLFPDRQDVTMDLTGWRTARGASGGPPRHGLAHLDRVSTLALRLTDPISLGALSCWLEEVIATWGDDLLRIKAILNVEGRAKPVVVHGVQRIFHPAVELEEWPDEDRASRLVLILYDIEPRLIVGSLRRTLAIRDEALHIVPVAGHAH